MSTNTPEIIADAEVEKQKTWERVADCIWRNNVSGMLYERPKSHGKFTFRSLKTKNQKHAKEEFHRRRSGVTTATKISTITAGAVIRKYQEDDYPDQQRQPRPARMHELEERNCKFLLPFPDRTGNTDANARLASMIAMHCPGAQLVKAIHRTQRIQSQCARHKLALGPIPPD